ncbi:hypothetical protein J4210_04220 [Candidatus Woesearchaeota archaeon]|nr:hypothetical protein [Candidatus Woesearchaeota archaeon]
MTVHTTAFEKNLIINNRELQYKGIFRAAELFSTINKALAERNYEKNEKKTEELVTEQGRRTYIELRPYKEKTNFAVLMIKIKITLDNVTEALETVDGSKRKFQDGDVLIIFDAWVMTDYEHRWTMKPWVYFWKSFINKYLYTFPLEAGLPREVVSDTAHVYTAIKKLLHSYKYQAGKVVREEDVRREMEKELLREPAEEI